MPPLNPLRHLGPRATAQMSALLITVEFLVALFASPCKAKHTLKAVMSNNCEWLEIVAHLLLVITWSSAALLEGANASRMQASACVCAAHLMSSTIVKAVAVVCVCVRS